MLHLSPPREAEAVFAVQEKYIAFGGAPGRREKLGRAHQGEAYGSALSGDTDAAGAANLSGAGNNHIRFLRRELAGIAGYRATARQFVFANGSVLDFWLLRLRRGPGPIPGGRSMTWFF